MSSGEPADVKPAAVFQVHGFQITLKVSSNKNPDVCLSALSSGSQTLEIVS